MIPKSKDMLKKKKKKRSRANSKQDPAKALNDYKKALALGGSRPLPELFSAAGCKFEFSAKTIQPLTKLLREELKKL